MRNRLPYLNTALLLTALAGCGSSDLAIVPVNGTVTFAGGPPPAEGSITFTPTEVQEGLPHRPGRASFDKQGVFQVTSFKEHDGLIPGTYYANVTCWMKPPS